MEETPLKRSSRMWKMAEANKNAGEIIWMCHWWLKTTTGSPSRAVVAFVDHFRKKAQRQKTDAPPARIKLACYDQKFRIGAEWFCSLVMEHINGKA